MTIGFVDSRELVKALEKSEPLKYGAYHSMAELAMPTLEETLRKHVPTFRSRLVTGGVGGVFYFYDGDDAKSCFMAGLLVFDSDKKTGLMYGWIGADVFRPEYLDVANKMKDEFLKNFGNHPMARQLSKINSHYTEDPTKPMYG